MSKTVPSYKMALEFEIETWKDFKKTLFSQTVQEGFDELIDICRKNAMAGRNTWNPMICRPIIISLLAQKKETT